MALIERFSQAVDEYSKLIEQLDRLTGDLRSATETGDAAKADRLKGEIEALLSELDQRRVDIEAQSEQLEKERDRAAELIA